MGTNLDFNQLRENMQNYKFVEHTGNNIPVLPETLVVYRTTSVNTPVSHIHHPIEAGKLNWSDEDQYMGAILEYARYVPTAKYFDDEGNLNTFNAHR
jgi:hypothetical protein